MIRSTLTKLARRALDARRRFVRDRGGMAAIEMAFIFPAMIIVYFGLVDVTDLLSANRRVTLAASTIGDLITQSNGTVTTAELNGFYQSVKSIMDPYPWNEVKIQVYDFQKNGSNPQLRWNHDNGRTCGAGPSTAGLIDLMTENNDLVVTRVCISVKTMIGNVLGLNTFDFKDEIILRPRQSETLTKS